MSAMIRAVAGDDVTDEMDTDLLESIGDTPYPLVVDDNDEVLAVVTVYGEKGYELARVVADAIQSKGAA